MTTRHDAATEKAPSWQGKDDNIQIHPRLVLNKFLHKFPFTGEHKRYRAEIFAVPCIYFTLSLSRRVLKTKEPGVAWRSLEMTYKDYYAVAVLHA
jgi:hypothetical protein